MIEEYLFFQTIPDNICNINNFPETLVEYLYRRKYWCRIFCKDYDLFVSIKQQGKREIIRYTHS